MEEDVPALTSRQSEILRFIRDAIEETGFPPTRAEITLAFNFRSPNAAEEHLRALARKGVIEVLQGTARGIRLKEAIGIPLIGRVAAGAPINAVLNRETLSGRAAIAISIQTISIRRGFS